jgi:glutamate/tyrosine decarboxylase-like PLP-dependent enzyme
VAWEKLCNYWDIETRWVDNREAQYTAAVEDLVAACDEGTIGARLGCCCAASAPAAELGYAGQGCCSRLRRSL